MLPSREDCQRIVKNSEAFYCTERIVENQKIEMYDYRMATENDFKFHNAYELRGLTFVYDEQTKTWERNILLNKFFNLGQCDGWLLEDIQHKKIQRVQEKLDGSIISFVKFKNGKIRAKSKMSFDSEQAIAAQKLFEENENIFNFVTETINDYITIWEYISPENQIVVNYLKPELRLLQIRQRTGEYVKNVKYYANLNKVQCAEEFDINEYTLNKMLEIKENSTDDIEGFIVTFEDWQMAKIKTDHYLTKHRLIGPDAFRENILVQTILDGAIDDVISSLSEDNPKKIKIKELEKLVIQDFNHHVIEFKELRRQYFQDFEEDRKKFAMKFKNNALFSYVMKTLNTSFRDVEATAENAIKEYILKQCKTLSSAKEYLERL